MSVFPTLKTGAVTQYPSRRSVQFSTVALQFLDGTEQRFRGYRGPLHEWVIQLSQLDQSELQHLQEFFRELDGQAESFAFTDPWDATTYASCSFSKDDMTVVAAGEWNASTALTIQENGT